MKRLMLVSLFTIICVLVSGISTISYLIGCAGTSSIGTVPEGYTCLADETPEIARRSQIPRLGEVFCDASIPAAILNLAELRHPENPRITLLVLDVSVDGNLDGEADFVMAVTPSKHPQTGDVHYVIVDVTPYEPVSWNEYLAYLEAQFDVPISEFYFQATKLLPLPECAKEILKRENAPTVY